MLAKITKGQDFYGCLRYVMRPESERIGGNMEGTTLQELVKEFNLSVQRQQRQSPRSPTQAIVCHTSLSIEVGRNLDSQTWNAIAKDYLNAMGFDSNQYVLIRHTDTEHDHVHLIIARPRLDGKTVSSWLDYRRAETVLRKIEQDYQLQSVLPSWETEVKAPTVAEVRHFRHTGEPSVRILLQVAIDEALLTAPDLETFQQHLVQYDIETRLRQINTSIAGISYKLNGIAFPGYKLGKRYTWSRIQTQLGENYERRNETSCQVETRTADGNPDEPIAPDLDYQSGTPSTTRTEAETHSGFSESSEEFDPRRTTTASVGKLPIAVADSIRESISAFDQHSATDRNKDATDELDFGGDPRESTSLSGDSSGTQECNRDASNDKQHAEPKAFGHQNSERTSDRASTIPEPTPAETDRLLDRTGEPIAPTCPDQTRMGQDLQPSSNLRNLDSLHRSPNAEIPDASDQSVSPTDTERSTQIMLNWKDYSDRIDELNPVKRDEKVVRLAIATLKQQDLSAQITRQRVLQLLWQSPYVQWIRETQGIERTSKYIKLTIQAAYQPEPITQTSSAAQRQRYRQGTLGREKLVR